MRHLSAWLKTIGNVFGVIVVFLGIFRFATEQSVAALLTSLAVVVAGPVEDLLQRLVRRRLPDPEAAEEGVALVDHSTSIAFLLLLLSALLLP